ncbi:hypothetical protein EGW08_022112, partial [Elysia chlorotica]
MERIKNLISPRARRKKLELAAVGGGGDSGGTGSGRTARTFGIPLEQLVARLPGGELSQPGPTVPFVVRRLCEFIYKHGLDNMGLFRVSGSVRVVERMRLQFELTGDVDLEGEMDVAATAGLLRVFLRDLPDTLVPEKLTPRFFNIVQGYTDKSVILEELKKALELLPEESYNVLKYISSLLVVVAENEAENKMTAYSLAILFGPNVFRYELTSGMGGLRDMDSSKEVMQLFISHYETLFADDDEPSPKQFWERGNKRRSPPPRPPPPKVQSMPSFQSQSLDSVDGPPMSQIMSSSTSSLDYRPVPSPRKIKNVLDISPSLEVDAREMPSLAVSSSIIPLFSPREDLDHNRAHSPFTLESETHSIIESPMITARTSEFVEKTIVQTISEHIFGSMDFNQNSGPHSPGSSKRFVNVDNIEGSPVDLPVARPRHTVAANASRVTTYHGTNGSDKLASQDDQMHEFDGIERNDILTGHKKPVGPPRRTPSRKHRHSVEGPVDLGGLRSGLTSGRGLGKTLPKLNHLPHGSGLNHHPQGGGNSNRDKENQGGRELLEGYSGAGTHSLSVAGSNNSSVSQVKDFQLGSPTSDIAGGNKPKTHQGKKNEDRALTPQSLSVLNSQESSDQSVQSLQSPSSSSPMSSSNGTMERSPTNGIKLFIPPLDFTTLHEHVDGTEPIPVSKGQFDTQIWIKTNQLAEPDETNVAVISPRSHKLKKKNGASTNTDIPPSPPIQQDIYKKHSDDECSYRLRQLTKKISGLKKKIKHFEEVFELQ